MNNLVIGLQWGDEGKAKFIDIFSKTADYIVRYQGGANAGHTVVLNGEEYIFHLVPSGLLYEDTIGILGPGMAIDIPSLVEEVEALEDKGMEIWDRLKISPRAHIVLEYHKYQDYLSDKEKNLGTTHRGIGPTYEDKAARSGLRISDLLDNKHFREKVENQLAFKNKLFTEVYDEDPLELEDVIDPYLNAINKVKPAISSNSTPSLLQEAMSNDKDILFEGAQGSLLDIDWGSYPYVTSSNSSAAGLHCSTGIALKYVDRTLGITKAYTTRVGKGPFPTELEEETAQKIRGSGDNIGDEYGSTTGRPRRCGWLDLFALKYSIQVNDIDAIALSKIDMLDNFDKIKICTAYKLDGELVKSMPSRYTELEKCEPIYEELPGWEKPVEGIQDKDNLPKNAMNFIKFVENEVDASIQFLSNGPQRDEIIHLKE